MSSAKKVVRICGSILPPFIIRHVASCGKNCEKSYSLVLLNHPHLIKSWLIGWSQITMDKFWDLAELPRVGPGMGLPQNVDHI